MSYGIAMIISPSIVDTSMQQIRDNDRPVSPNRRISRDWHQIYFDWDDVVDGCVGVMQQQYELLWRRAGKPTNAALFLHRLATGGRHIYFSPAASKIAETLLERHSGTQCQSPAALSPALLVGHRDTPAQLLARGYW